MPSAPPALPALARMIEGSARIACNSCADSRAISAISPLIDIPGAGVLDIDQIERELLLLDRPISPKQMAGARNALAIVQGLRDVPVS